MPRRPGQGAPLPLEPDDPLGGVLLHRLVAPVLQEVCHREVVHGALLPGGGDDARVLLRVVDDVEPRRGVEVLGAFALSSPQSDYRILARRVTAVPAGISVFLADAATVALFLRLSVRLSGGFLARIGLSPPGRFPVEEHSLPAALSLCVPAAADEDD